jgi:hypothetical protein
VKALLLAALLALGPKALAVPPGEMGSLPLLLEVASVRKELGLSASQRRQIAALGTEYREGMRQLAGGADASARERAGDLRSSTNARALAVLSGGQRQQLAAIERRALGATLLYSESARRELDLSRSQHRSIESIRSDATRVEREINRAFEAGTISASRRVALLREDRIARARKIWDLLTPEQRKAFWAGSRTA